MKMIRIEEYPTKLFINDIEFNQNTTWVEIKDLFEQRYFHSNSGDVELTVDYVRKVLIEDNVEVHLVVQFIDNQIQSASICIPSIDQDYDANDSMDFYKQAGKRDQQYSKWLKKYMLSSTVKSPDSFVLVGENKSADTFIVIHWNEL